MRVVKCPDEFQFTDSDESVVFMAGGITRCPDWHRDVLERSKTNTKNIALLTPRRDDWDSYAGSSEDQIAWEHKHLKYADWVFFWFPKEGKCMITLFELGCALGEGRNIRVGVEPGYVRELDVREQIKHRLPNLPIYSTLDELYEPIL